MPGKHQTEKNGRTQKHVFNDGRCLLIVDRIQEEI